MRFMRAKGVDEDLNLGEDTLILPVISTGNVGQLAVDLLLSTGRAHATSPPLVTKVGYLDTDLVAPVAGYEVFAPGEPPQLCVSLELHRFAKSGITVLHQRGPILPGQEQAFAAELVQWAQVVGFKGDLTQGLLPRVNIRALGLQDILVLAGADAAEGVDPTPLGRAGIKRVRAQALVAGQSASTPSTLDEALRNVGVGEFRLPGAMEPHGTLLQAPNGGALFDASGEISDTGGVGAGGEDGVEAVGTEEVFSRRLLLPTGTGVAGFLCEEAAAAGGQGARGTPSLIVLLYFCSEGDNTPQAIEMAETVNAAFNFLPRQGSPHDDGTGDIRWSSPLSWASLYGPPPASDVYQ